jgi:hypothetical protein
MAVVHVVVIPGGGGDVDSIELEMTAQRKYRRVSEIY